MQTRRVTVTLPVMHDEITRGQDRRFPQITTAAVPVYIRISKCRRRLTYLVRCALLGRTVCFAAKSRWPWLDRVPTEQGSNAYVLEPRQLDYALSSQKISSRTTS